MERFLKKSIEINIDCEVASKEICMIIIESLLKYILYQFQQIPVQIDVLEKELIKGETPLSLVTNDNEELPDEDGDKRVSLKQKGLKKRIELSNRMQARKRKIWLLKIKKFLNNFKTTLQILENEIEKGSVSTVVYAVGTTPFTPKFIFKIHIPMHLDLLASSVDNKSSCVLKRKVLLNMLKAFTNSYEISKLTSSNFSASKLWTLLETKSSSLQEKPLSSENLISLSDFSLSPRARCVDIILGGKNCPLSRNAAMELTPCVNSNNHRSPKISLFRSPRISCTREETDFNNDLDSFFESLDYKSDSPNTKSVIFAKPSSVKVFDSLNDKAARYSAPYTPFRQKDDFSDQSAASLRTPYFNGFSDCNFMEETPVVSHRGSTPSPVKHLAKSITDLRFSPRTESIEIKNFSWFRVDFALTGFKDICVINS